MKSFGRGRKGTLMAVGPAAVILFSLSGPATTQSVRPVGGVSAQAERWVQAEPRAESRTQAVTGAERPHGDGNRIADENGHEACRPASTGSDSMPPSASISSGCRCPTSFPWNGRTDRRSSPVKGQFLGESRTEGQGKTSGIRRLSRYGGPARTISRTPARRRASAFPPSTRAYPNSGDTGGPLGYDRGHRGRGEVRPPEAGPVAGGGASVSLHPTLLGVDGRSTTGISLTGRYGSG